MPPCFRVRTEIGQRHTVAHHIDAVRRVAIKLLRLALHHLGIRHDVLRAAGKQRPFEFESVAILPAHATKPSAAWRRRCIAPLYPSLMDSVTRSINIALPDAFQAQEEVATLFRLGLYEFVRKTASRVARQSRNRPPRPLASRPGGIGKKPRRVTGFAHAMSQPLQIGFGAARLGMTTTNQANR